MPVRLDICRPVVPSTVALTFRPAIVVIHGGSWMEGDKSEPQWRRCAIGWPQRATSRPLSTTASRRSIVYPDGDHGCQHAVRVAARPGTGETVRHRPHPDRRVRRVGRRQPRGAPRHAGARFAVRRIPRRSCRGAERPRRPHRVGRRARHPAAAGARRTWAAVPLPPARRRRPRPRSTTWTPPIRRSSSRIRPTNSFRCRSPSISLHVFDAAHVPVTLQTEPGDLHSVSMLTDTLRARIVDFFHTELVHRATTRS